MFLPMLRCMNFVNRSSVLSMKHGYCSSIVQILSLVGHKPTSFHLFRYKVSFGQQQLEGCPKDAGKRALISGQHSKVKF